MKIEFLENIKQKDPAAKSYLQIILFYPGVQAVFLHKIAHFFYVKKLTFIAYFIAYFSRFLTGIEIHPQAKIGKNLFIDHGHGVVIGQTAEIHDNVLIYHGVTLGSRNYSQSKRHPTIKNNVILGAGVKIIGDVVIGENAKIGAGAVIYENITPNEIIIASENKKIIKDKIEYYI